MKKIYIYLIALAISLPALADGGEPLPEYSPNYIAFDEDNWELLSYNRITGSGVIGFTGDPPPFQAGLSITNIASDTMGYFLRRITELEQIGNTLLIETIKADMEDVFLNKSFILSSAVMPPNNPNTNGMSNEEISRAMTSAKGHIHPVEIIYHYGGENKRSRIDKIDLLDPNNPYAGRNSDTFNVFHVYELWEDYELFSSGNLEFMLDEAMLSFKADAILAFDFRARPASDTTIIKDGQLDKVTFTIEGEAMAKADLSLTASVEYEKEEEEVELYTDIISVTQKFFVGPVIVWVTFSLDLLADYFVHAHAEVQATWGFEASQTVVIGGSFLPPTNDWVPIFEEEFSYEITPIEVTGEASVDAKLMIYPRAKLFLYSAAGPYADLIPWAGANFAGTAMVNTDGDTDLKWNANIDLGLDQRIGIKPAWLESLIGQLGPWEDTLYYDRIWEAPHKLSLTTKLENSYVLPVTIPLQFRVSDNLGFRTPLAPVFFEADHGELSKEWAVCNLTGIATVDWTFDEENFDQSQEIHTLSASLINAEDETIQSIQVRVGLNTKSTACYIEELSHADSVIFEDVVFTGIQKGIFANDKNLASLRVNEVTFEDCESAISGHYGNVEVTHNTSFGNCQTAMHLTGTDPLRNRLAVHNAEFNSISLMGIYFLDMLADIRHSNFQDVKTAIQGNGGRERDAVAFIIDVTINESENALNVNNLEYVYVRDVEIKRAGVPDSTTMYTALSAENIWQVDIESVNIENYFNAFYGSHFRATNRIGKMKVLNCIRGIDLRNVTNTNIFENLIKLDHAVGPESAIRDEYFGIYLLNSHKNQIARNNLINLCTAIKQMGCEGNTLSANSFWGCQCDETGIRSDASNTKITNNNFEGNAGAALLFENATAWAIANNNFIENDFGIKNLTTATTIEGHGNYFIGQLGANTAGNVQTYNDLDEKVSLVCDFLPDTLFIPYGGTDSIGLHVQNFVHLNDSVIINISEELDWISNDLVHYLALKDSLGGMIDVRFEIPAFDPDAPLPQNAQTVWANLISVPFTNTAVDSIIVFVYEQQLDSLYILPEKPTIFIGDSIKFIAQSIDQHGIPVETGIAWQASEGIIDETGWLFTPDEFEGEIMITATDTLSGIAAYGTVMVTDEWPMLQHIEIKPAIAELNPHQSIKFQADGFNQFGYPYDFVPAWEASGGLISNDGFYRAPDSTGIYSIMAHSLYDGMSGDALARIRCFTYTDDYHLLCGSDSVLINNEWIKTAGLYNDTILNPGFCDQVRTWEVVKFELPEVQIILPPIVCEGSDAFELSGGTPVGGTYSGTGVDANGWFDPAVSGTGSFEISYTYTDENTCTATATEIIQVEPILEVDVSITADETVICSGETVHFAALAVNPGSAPLYQWFINGIQQGENSPVFSYAPADNDEVSLVLTSSNTCSSGNPAISNIISISVNPVLAASVSISSTQTEVCENTEVGFTAEIQNGGNNPVFQWYVNGNAAGTNNPFFTYTPIDGDEVHVVMESDLVCVAGSPAISNTSIISVVDNLPVAVSIETDETLVCEGTDVTFTATAVNGGNDPVFHWTVNGSHTGNNTDTFSYVPADNDLVNVILTSSENCASNNPATSNSINMQLIPVLEVGVSIEADAASVCEGETLTFMATAVNGGNSPEYQWQLNGVNIGSNSPIFSYVPTHGDQINTILTSSAECVQNNPAVSNTITTIVNPPIIALVSIEASETTVCIGETVSFTATSIHGGPEPFFEWLVNGTTVGTNSPVFSYIPANGDAVQLEMTSNADCVTNNPAQSNTIVMEVITSLEISVSIEASATTICEGESVVFTASAINGGAFPVYQWQLNGNYVGTNSPTFTYAPDNNDVITVLLTSSESCAVNNPAVSNAIMMQVYPSANVGVSIEADQTEVCDGEAVAFTATAINGGTNPHFQWIVNGNPAGSNNPEFTYIPSDDDLVSVLLTSNVNCAQNNPAASNVVTLSVIPVTEAGVSIVADQTNLCSGTEVFFEATTVNGGSDPYFQWMVNGNHTGPDSPYFSYVPEDNDEVTLIMTSSENCVSNNPAVSNTVALTVIPTVEVDVIISVDAIEVCEGEMVTFEATYTNGGLDPHFQWQVNGINAGSNSSVFSYLPSDNDVVKVILTSNEACALNNPALSNAITLTVYPLVEVEVNIHTTSTEVCEGTVVAYNVTTANGGSNPTYQWNVNGLNAGTNNPVFMYTPLDGDEVSLVFTSSESCVTNNPATSNTLVMTVVPNVDVDVFIEADATEVCEGEPVYFTATALNGGTNPAYVWKVNGVNTGANSPFFNYLPSDNDSVMVMLISSISCANNNPALSETINITVDPIPEVSWVTFEPDTLCIFWAAVPLHGGLPEGGYYTGNGVSNNTFDPETAGPGQHIITYHYTSEHGCYNTAQYILFVDYCTYIHSGVDAGNHIYVFPNPADDYFIIQIEDHILINNDLNYQLFDVYGRVLDAGELTATYNRISMEAIIVEVVFVRIESEGKLIKYFKLVKMQ